MSYHIQLFHSLLNNFLEGEAALVTTDGDVLAVRGVQPASFGTLTTAAKNVGAYLKLQENDIAILNDPYSGGTTLDEMTFVMAISEDLLWVRRKQLGKSIKSGKNVEEEGIRIPPTPLFQHGKINEMILTAMQSHPLCPAQFNEWIKAEFADMGTKARKLLNTIEGIGFEITGELIEEYLNLSKHLAQEKISESTTGETRVDIVLDSGELLRLNIDIHDGKILLDFGGTSAGNLIHLTEHVAFGTCFHTISRYYNFTEYANSGTFAALQVTKPSGCWLMAKYPASTLKGMSSGIAAIQTGIELGLSQIHSKKEKALCSHSPILIQLNTKTNATCINLKGGRGASLNQHGTCTRIEEFSIEQFEREFPVKVLRADYRIREENKDKFLGGRGLNLQFEALESFEATWSSDLTKTKPRITKNCSLGSPSEISLATKGNTTALPNHGSQVIVKGDILTLLSGNGGGFGTNADK